MRPRVAGVLLISVALCAASVVPLVNKLYRTLTTETRRTQSQHRGFTYCGSSSSRASRRKYHRVSSLSCIF